MCIGFVGKVLSTLCCCRSAELFSVSGDGTVVSTGTIQAPCSAIALHSDSIFCVVDSAIEVLAHGGAFKQKLQFEAMQGLPLHLHVNGNFLAVATSRNQFQVFKLGGREVKPHAGPGNDRLDPTSLSSAPSIPYLVMSTFFPIVCQRSHYLLQCRCPTIARYEAQAIADPGA